MGLQRGEGEFIEMLVMASCLALLLPEPGGASRSCRATGSSCPALCAAPRLGDEVLRGGDSDVREEARMQQIEDRILAGASVSAADNAAWRRWGRFPCLPPHKERGRKGRRGGGRSCRKLPPLDLLRSDTWCAWSTPTASWSTFLQSHGCTFLGITQNGEVCTVFPPVPAFASCLSHFLDLTSTRPSKLAVTCSASGCCVDCSRFGFSWEKSSGICSRIQCLR